MKLIFPILCLLSMSIVLTVSAQDVADAQPLELPDCDIFLFNLNETEEGAAISNGRNITERPGYDNQPWFTPNSESILFSANYSPNQTDIYEYFLESGQIEQVTHSVNQEYSPQVSPDNTILSFVTDGETANQSVWYLKRGNDAPEWLMENQGEREPVGYYSWNHDSGYILYWSRYGFSMRLIHRSKDISHYVAGNALPSTPHIIPNTSHFSFLHRQLNGEVWIKELNPETLAVRPLISSVGTNHNYCWTPSGWILMCDGTRLNRWSPQSGKGWELIADLKQHGLSSATRVATSPDGSKLAVVGVPADTD